MNVLLRTPFEAAILTGNFYVTLKLLSKLCIDDYSIVFFLTRRRLLSQQMRNPRTACPVMGHLHVQIVFTPQL